LRRLLAGILVLCSVAPAQAPRSAGAPAKRPAQKAATAPAKAAAPPATTLPSEATVDSFLRHFFGYNPGLSWKVNAIQASDVPGMAEVLITFANGDQPQRMRMFVSADGEHAIIGDAIPFGADPFADERKLLQRRADGVARGAAKPAALIVEFSDLQCPHCKAAHPIVERLLAEEPQAKLVFQHFPLPMHDWAEKAARYADCAGQTNNEAFWKFVGAVFAAQEEITAQNADEKLAAAATASGVDAVATRACAQMPAAAARVQASFALGRDLDVTGTPTVFINGRRVSSIGSLPYEELKAIVDFEIKLAGERK
jgi:protein-disulfide isomerase